jgi:hypothetical protein
MLTRLLNRPGLHSIPEMSEILQVSKLVQDTFGFGPKQAFVCVRESNLDKESLHESSVIIY